MLSGATSFFLWGNEKSKFSQKAQRYAEICFYRNNINVHESYRLAKYFSQILYLSYFLGGLFTNYSCFQTENSNDGEKTQWKAFPCKWKTFPCKRRTFPRTRKTFPLSFFLMRRKFFSHHWLVWVGVVSISGGKPTGSVKNTWYDFIKERQFANAEL